MAIERLDKWHSTQEIAPGTWRIDEAGYCNAYLLAGSERALLIDTGAGIGDIRSVTRELTDLPVDVALTHAHVDNVGGVNWFTRYHVHRADTGLIYTPVGLRPFSKSQSGNFAPGSAYRKQPLRARRVPMDGGELFQLGGRTVRAEHTPGHTGGCVTFVDEREKLMFTGDEVCPRLCLWIPGALTVEEWLPGAERILELSYRYRPWGGHGDRPETPESIARLVDLGKDLLVFAGRNSPLPKIETYPEEGVEPSIRHNSARVYKKK